MMGRRKRLVPGASAIYLFNEGAGQVLTDYSGNGYHGTLGSTTGDDTHDPAWGATGLTFVADDYVSISGLIPALQGKTALTLQIVASTAASTPHAGLIGPVDPSTAARNIINILDNSDGGTAADALHFLVYGDAGAVAGVNIPGKLSATPTTLTVRYVGGSVIEGRKGNGTWARTTAAVPASMNSSVAVPTLNIGRRASFYLTGTVSAMIVYTRALSDAECEQNRQYLKDALAARGVVLP